MNRRDFTRLLAAAGGFTLPGAGTALSQTTEPVVAGVLLDGTASWEMQTIRDRGLDAEHGIALELMDVSNKQAGHVALLSRAADVILSDYIWVAALRAAGERLTCVPHSLAVGGLMIPEDSDLASITDLPGRRIGVAGGPMDKSWIALQALYARQTGQSLAERAEVRFGAPPLINELLGSGRIDASLNFWHFNARAKAAGHRELISVAGMLSGLGISPPPPLLAWVFHEETLARKEAAIRGFLDASFAAKQVLLAEDAAWPPLRDRMRAAGDDTLFRTLRADYRAGIVPGYDAQMIAAAARAFAIMAEHGGPDLVGDSAEMDPGTFWRGYLR